MIDIFHVIAIYDGTGQYDGEEHLDPETQDLEARLDNLEVNGLHGSVTTYGECYCGDTVELEGFTNECENCGLLFNMSGQELMPEQELRPCDEWEDY